MSDGPGSKIKKPDFSRIERAIKTQHVPNDINRPRSLAVVKVSVATFAECQHGMASCPLFYFYPPRDTVSGVTCSMDVDAFCSYVNTGWPTLTMYFLYSG